MGQRNDIGWSEAGELEVLTFDLHSETFALEAVLVREILDLLPETPVPGANPLVGGVVNFRGKIIPIADLRPAFGFPVTEATIDSRIVVIEMAVGDGSIQVGIRADQVHEVATLRREASEAPPVVGLRWRPDFIRGMVRRPGGGVVLPDLPSIFGPLLGGPATPELASVR
ncbi:chemotaxis protein CheW [Sphingomonas glaciei]|uniref:Chemotaxis protein CheW n=1 Tax=Sphingomonas glaciei TaxID=2938948 RepID=A0ABY5MXW9_9SPHN|nr:chemotaxis protein CheW [Sphingomonas glaciei]UUR08329.1 chemotaxis protein CheW [Sphingomonas glaciei]